jgi:hypothetical protein
MRASGTTSSRRSRSGGTASDDDVQAIKQIFAERPLMDQPAEIPVRRADDANVQVTGPGFPHPAGFAPLQKAQELGLHPQGHLADLVEQQRSPVRVP